MDLAPVSRSIAAHISTSLLCSVESTGLIVKLAHLERAALARVLNPATAAAAVAANAKFRRDTSSDPPLSSGADVAPALLLKFHHANDSRRYDADARKRHDFVAFALSGRGLGIAHMLSTRPGISFLASEMRSFDRRIVVRSHGDARTVGDDLDLKLFAPAVIEVFGVDRVAEREIMPSCRLWRLEAEAMHFRLPCEKAVACRSQHRNQQGDDCGDSAEFEHGALPLESAFLKNCSEVRAAVLI